MGGIEGTGGGEVEGFETVDRALNSKGSRVAVVRQDADFAAVPKSKVVPIRSLLSSPLPTRKKFWYTDCTYGYN